MVKLEPHPQGVILPVKAQPGAKRSGIRGEHDGQLKVSVTQIAEKGKANESLVEVLAKSLGLRKSQVTMIAGETSSQKRFLLTETTVDELAVRIAAALRQT
jgi:uncharacterized protein (TIGR00251 family)